jgi:hypothetical protein
MTTFEITPHVGVGPINLGMTREEVHFLLGDPQHAGGGREGFLRGFMVDFDDKGRVEFIELACSEMFKATFHGICLHEVPAKEALDFLCRFDKYDESDPELGHSYVFLDLQMSLWRGTRPAPDQHPDDPDGRYFEAVGIAVDGYFTSSKESRRTSG